MKQLSPLIKLFPRLILIGLCFGAIAQAVFGAVIGATAAHANNANTYAEGYAAGASNTAYAMGAIYPTLPPGATVQTIGSATYYLYNEVWFSPSYGANGVYYRVVPTP